jgi:hypothetical protein
MSSPTSGFSEKLRKEKLTSVKRVSKVDELLPALYFIGTHKNELPTELRGWVNILDLYVQLRYVELLATSFDSLIAGGKHRGYFSATCDYPQDSSGYGKTLAATMVGDFTSWKIRKFDQQIWEKRFAHLVEPTAEIAWYLSIPDKEDPMRTYDSKSDTEKYTIQLLPKLENAVKHFQSTGEWVGLHNHKCMSCGKGVSWWTYFHSEPCPYCSGKVRG